MIPLWLASWLEPPPQAPDAADRVLARLRAEGWRLHRGEACVRTWLPCYMIVELAPIPVLQMIRGERVTTILLTGLGILDYQLHAPK